MPLVCTSSASSARASCFGVILQIGPPTITAIANNLNGSTVGGEIEISFTAPLIGSDTLNTYQYSIDGGVTWVNRSDGGTTASPIKVSNLTNGTSYSVAIRGSGTLGFTNSSSTTTARPIKLPTAPSISAVSAGNTTATVDFSLGTAGTDDNSNIQYKIGSGAWVTRSPASTASPLALTGLTNDVSYTVAIRTVTSAGSVSAESAASNTFIPRPPVPGALSLSFSSTNISERDNAYLSWTSASNAYTYDVFRNGVKVVSDTTATSATVSCGAGSTCNYYVVAKNTAGTSTSNTKTMVGGLVEQSWTSTVNTTLTYIAESDTYSMTITMPTVGAVGSYDYKRVDALFIDLRKSNLGGDIQASNTINTTSDLVWMVSGSTAPQYWGGNTFLDFPAPSTANLSTNWAQFGAYVGLGGSSLSGATFRVRGKVGGKWSTSIATGLNFLRGQNMFAVGVQNTASSYS